MKKNNFPKILSTLFFSLYISATTYAKAAPDCNVQQYQMALKYQQGSPEIQALQRQSYLLATLRIQQYLEQNPQTTKPLAVVTDLDETVLDNSALLARDTLACHDWSTWDTWSAWEKNGTPTLIAGSLDFFNFLNDKGIKIFYVSDRSDENKTTTLATLKQLQLPQVNADQVLLLGPEKQKRRDAITAQGYQIIMLLGDTLHDFSNDFSSKQNKSEGLAAVEKNKAHFGTDWIVLPNASYGNWHKNTLNIWQGH
ncbi:5'-nucleotidase, lipoprotein e(P4) family [Acinetobacter boissieri]|uniref:5'-nucleotidase, lipoprotein e(P4) family n=1 Tax=Acinetobacter boissieri TaxID=1219383 RepID=A0A1G6IIQ9_9GAMM|nr:HAD family acid phosphatase [Acinetobacter boissieri]SDC06472.1 5'-nucleotidase, lipoprotein e(P4) family [Acinetobacter boissieri]